MSKAIIIYYSYTGNTKKVAELLSEELKKKFIVREHRLETINKEAKSYVVKLMQAVLRKKIGIKNVPFDVGPYDLVCLGSLVRAMGLPPALRAYLGKVSGLNDKKVVIFVTHQTNLGKILSLKQMEKILGKLGVRDIRKFSVKENDIRNDELIKMIIRDTITNYA